MKIDGANALPAATPDRAEGPGRGPTTNTTVSNDLRADQIQLSHLSAAICGPPLESAERAARVAHTGAVVAAGRYHVPAAVISAAVIQHSISTSGLSSI